MAIIYLDLYSGDDLNDGLTISTPVKTMNMATSLVTAQSDEIRVRGTDSISESIGMMSWRHGWDTLSGTTDLTAILNVGNLIYKQSDVVPEIYKIASLDFTDNVMYVQLTLMAGIYRGKTEDTNIMRIILPSDLSQTLTMQQDGYKIGDYPTYTGTSISGGWDESYVNKTGFTILYDSNFIGTNTILWQGSTKNWWDISEFIFIEGYWNYQAGHNTRFYNCSFVVGLASISGNYITIDNCKIVGWNCYDYLVSGTYYIINNSVLTSSVTCTRDLLQSTITNSRFGNCTQMVMVGTVASDIIGNEIYGDGTNTIYSATYNLISGNTLSAVNSLFYSNILGNNIINNTILPLSVKNMDTIGSNIISNTNITSFTNLTIGTSLTYSNKNLTMDEFPIPITKLYVNDSTYIKDQTNGNLVSSIFKLKDNNNMIYFNNASLISITGDTQSGTSALEIKQFSDSWEAIATTVEFFVTENKSYTLSYWVKSSNDCDISYNLNYFGNYLYSNWETGNTSSYNWTEVTKVIDGSVLTHGGLIKLVIKFNSGIQHWVKISAIKLTEII